MTFGKSIDTCITKKYFVFNGRASRSEFWWFYLFTIFGYIFCAIVDAMLGTTPVFYWLFAIGTLAPYFAVACRRLHDVGYSGWLQLLSITIIGIIPLLIWLCTKGKGSKNRYGKPARS